MGHAAEKLDALTSETADPALVVDLAQYKRRRSRAGQRLSSGRSHLRYETASGPCSYLFDGIDHPLRIARPGASTNYYYYELDLAGNVRGLRASGGASLGGYRYSAFGQTLEDTSLINQPLRWKGRWFSPVAGGTYDVRARQWSPELGVFLSVDEFREHSRKTTLWGWPGQNPLRWRDPSGRGPDTLCSLFGWALGSLCDPDDPEPPPDPPSPGGGGGCGKAPPKNMSECKDRCHDTTDPAQEECSKKGSKTSRSESGEMQIKCYGEVLERHKECLNDCKSQFGDAGP